MAIVAAGRVPAWIPVIWLGVSGLLLLVRRKVLAGLPTRSDLAMPARLRLAFRFSLVNGLTHASFLAVFPFLSEPERAMFTLLLIAVCTGTVGTTAGNRPIFLAYVLPVMATLAVFWIWSPGVSNPGLSERSIGFLLIGYLWILLGLARAAWATFSESFNIRFQEHKLNARLQGALENANKANEAKTRFLASASHDLRQPLHTISMLVAALSLRPLTGRDREIVDVLSLVTESLAEQLDGLLDISKLDAGVVQAEIATIDLCRLVNDLFDGYRAVILQKGLDAQSQCEAGVWVESDTGLLTRVIRNLIDNAIKFTEKGFVSIELISAEGKAVLKIAVALRVSYLIELFKNFVLLVCSDAAPAIRNLQDCLAFCGTQFDGNKSLFCEFDGVVDQFTDNPRQ